MKKASREMGFGDDWQKALEKVKNAVRAAGETAGADPRPRARGRATTSRSTTSSRCRALAARHLAHGDDDARAQLVNPFFTGGEVISVSYPTDTMTHDGQDDEHARQQHPLLARDRAARADSRATTCKGFMAERYNTAPRAFGTPFMGEGWALYWELLLWDMSFPQTPEDRDRHAVLAHAPLRPHHLLAQLPPGKMTPEQCIDLLVDASATSATTPPAKCAARSTATTRRCIRSPT